MEPNTPFIPLIGMFVVVFFFMIRPQIKRQKKEREFEEGLVKGKKVITKSGLHGKILDIIESKNIVVLETPAGKLNFDKSAISAELSAKLEEDSKK